MVPDSIRRVFDPSNFCLVMGKLPQICSPVFTTPPTVSENCYVIFGVLIIVASIRRDEGGHSIFLTDKMYIYS